MINRIIRILTSINPWHFLWIGIIFSELLTAGISILVSYLLWGRVIGEVLIIGAVDSFLVSFIVCLLVIYFIKHTSRLDRINEQLQNEINERRNIEDALRENEKRFRLLSDVAFDGIAIMEAGIFQEMNSEFATIFGYTPPDILGSHISKLVAPECLEDVVQKLNSGYERPYETTGVKRDGTKFPFEFCGKSYAQGNRILRVTAIRDISERKKMADMILQAKSEWEETFDTINDAITIHDRNFNILRANKAAERLLGLSFRKIFGQKCYVSYHGSDCPPDGCPSCQTLQTGEPSMTELFEPHLNKHLEIKALPRIDRGNRITGLVHVVRDITERKKTEDKLRKAYRMNYNILEKSPFGIYVVNEDGTLEYANPAMLHISGVSLETFTGNNVFELPPYKEIGLSEKFRNCLRGEPFFLGPVTYTSYLGKKTTVRNFIGIPLDEDDKRKVLVFVEDITQSSQAEEKQRTLRSQLLQSQKMESIGRLAGGVAHDFNNVLTAIIGYSELALLKMTADSPLREHLNIIKAAGEKASSLTQQLLAFSRKQVLEMKAVNLNSTIEHLSRILERTIGEDISLEIKTTSPVRNIIADPAQIEQVILNLVVNARDAMPMGGRITIETADIDSDEEFIRNHREMTSGPYVLFSVSDTGMGMTREVQEKIFEPFFTTKELGKGTGLGLATVYGIVKQHNGYIYVCSEPGMGTTFDIFLPVSDTVPVKIGGEELTTLARGRETILIVEDDHDVLRLVRDILRTLGYKVLEASGADEACTVSDAYEGAIDVILTDVIMPDMDGRELADKLIIKRPGMRILLMSGYSDDRISLHGVLDSGITLIQKPISPAKLAAKLREVLDKPIKKREG